MTVRIYGFTPPARLDAYRNFQLNPPILGDWQPHQPMIWTS